MTHTIATLEVSPAAHGEIAAKLRAAGYDHAFMEGGLIDMSGIGIEPAAPAESAGQHDVWAFICDVAQQVPEKPDYWSSCGQCDRNKDRAEDLLSARSSSPIEAGASSGVERYRCKRCGATINAGEKLTCTRGPCPMELVESPVHPESWKQLMSFYDVDTPAKMVEAMERHIKMLQDKLPKDRFGLVTCVREG